MLSFVRDLPNACSLAGLFATTLGIYYAVRDVYPAAMIALLWAVVFDWTDGLIARRMKDRTTDQGAFGAQLDSLIDIVSFGVAPAVLLLSVGQFNPWFIPGAFVILATAAVRLSHFNVFGLVDHSAYRGLSLDNNVLILAVVFLLQPAFGITAFSIILYVTLMALAVLNLAPIQTPKLAGLWYAALVLFALALTAVYWGRLA